MLIYKTSHFHFVPSSSGSIRIHIPGMSAQSFSTISEATRASSFQNPVCVMQSFRSFCKLSVSGFVVRYSPFWCLPLGNSHLTISRTPAEYGLSGLYFTRLALSVFLAPRTDCRRYHRHKKLCQFSSPFFFPFFAFVTLCSVGVTADSKASHLPSERDVVRNVSYPLGYGVYRCFFRTVTTMNFMVFTAVFSAR